MPIAGTYSYLFDVLFEHGRAVEIEVRAANESKAYRNLYELVNATAVIDARIKMHDNPRELTVKPA